MSKKSDISMLVPGPVGWEIWKRDAEGGLERTLENGPARVGEISDLPGGELMLFFPVKGYHALPFRAESTDDELFDDLAVMHAERLGIRPDPMAGQLSDRFVVAVGEDSTTLLHVVLKSPGEGELPLRTPQDFDLSARAYPVEGDAVTAWKELGRWVFAIHAGGKLLYSQATAVSVDVPDAVLLREIKLALGQLGMQELELTPDHVHVWPPQGDLGEAGSLADGLGVPATVARRPDPQLPEKSSNLLPADVRAARRERQQRNKRRALVGALGVAYLAFLGWVFFGLWSDIRDRNRLQREAALVEGVSIEFQTHAAKWAELGPVVADSRSPMEVMLQVGAAIPPNSGLRLDTASITAGDVKSGGTVTIRGAAPQSAPVNAFSLALKRSPDLGWLEWETGVPNNTQKGWEFVFSGTEQQ